MATGASWFETALARLLTMRIGLCAAYLDLILRSRAAASPDDASHRLEKDGPRKERRRASSFSRRAASEFCNQITLIENRGRREGRVPFAPMVRVQKKSTRQNHRYEPNNRPSLRNGFTAYT
jgi:hypothetical protein